MTQMNPSRLFLILALAALEATASAVTLSFPDLTIPAGPPFTGESGDPVYTTSVASNLGSLQRSATLSFTLVNEGEAWIDDLAFSISDPGGTTTMAKLPGAPARSGEYTGTATFASLAPTSGTYRLSFADTFGSAFDSTLTNIRLDVVPATPVPEPASLSILGFGALALVRRRRTPRR